MTPQVDVQPPTPSRTELQLRAAIRVFAATYGLCERGRPISDVRMNQLARRLAAVARPEPRPVDVEQPRVPRGAAERSAAIRARQAEVPPEPVPPAVSKPKPARVAPPLPPLPERLDDELRAVVAEVGTGASNPVIGKRLGISEDRVKYAVSRAKRILGVSDRKVLAVALAEVLALGGGDAGGERGPACPPAASNPQIQARGASEPQRPAGGPFWPIAAEESPATTPGHAPDGLAGPGSPSGPPRPAAGGTEPHSAAAAPEADQR